MDAKYELKKLAEELSQFRNTRKTKLARIPKEFWLRAADLTKKLPLNVVSKTCKLNSYQLRKKSKIPSPVSTSADQTIIRLAPVQLSVQDFVKQSITLTIKGLQGELRIEVNSESQLSACIRTFMEKVS